MKNTFRNSVSVNKSNTKEYDQNGNKTISNRKRVYSSVSNDAKQIEPKKKSRFRITKDQKEFYINDTLDDSIDLLDNFSNDDFYINIDTEDPEAIESAIRESKENYKKDLESGYYDNVINEYINKKRINNKDNTSEMITDKINNDILQLSEDQLIGIYSNQYNYVSTVNSIEENGVSKKKIIINCSSFVENVWNTSIYNNIQTHIDKINSGTINNTIVLLEAMGWRISISDITNQTKSTLIFIDNNPINEYITCAQYTYTGIINTKFKGTNSNNEINLNMKDSIIINNGGTNNDENDSFTIEDTRASILTECNKNTFNSNSPFDIILFIRDYKIIHICYIQSNITI